MTNLHRPFEEVAEVTFVAAKLLGLEHAEYARVDELLHLCGRQEALLTGRAVTVRKILANDIDLLHYFIHGVPSLSGVGG